MTTYLGKSCSLGLPQVPFVNCRQFMYFVISLLVLRAGYGIWLYQFLIIAYLFTLSPGRAICFFLPWYLDFRVLHMDVQLPVLLCAVKTVEGDFRFCWTITPNVGQTHKENPNLVRILYMVCTLNDIYKQYNKLHEHWYTKNQFTSLCRGQKPASKCIRLVYEILVICRALQALYTPQRCELMKTKTNNTNCSYRIFIVCRSPVSPVFWARIRLSY